MLWASRPSCDRRTPNVISLCVGSTVVRFIAPLIRGILSPNSLMPERDASELGIPLSDPLITLPSYTYG